MTVTASGFRPRTRVTPTVSVPSPQACWITLVTSSEVMIAASLAYWSSPWRPSAARTRERATRTDSGMPGSMNAVSCGPTSTAVLLKAHVLPVPA